MARELVGLMLPQKKKLSMKIWTIGQENSWEFSVTSLRTGSSMDEHLFSADPTIINLPYNLALGGK